jgi:cyclopropane fatty-acyl-phospholipid synthase-like methyltransferase
MDRMKPTIDSFNKMAQSYEDRFMHFDLYNDTYDSFCSLIKKYNAEILDAGCGPGNISHYLLSKRPDFKILGIDLAPNMLELAGKNNPSAEFNLLDVRAIDQLKRKFDGIVCGFCVPYLSKEECAKLIADAYDLLDEAGVLYLSAIEGNYESSGYEMASNGVDKGYVYYYKENDLKDYFLESGFNIREVFRKSYPKGGKVDTHLIFILKK